MIAAVFFAAAAALALTAASPAGGQSQTDTAITIAGIDDATAVSMQLDRPSGPSSPITTCQRRSAAVALLDPGLHGPQTSVLLDGAGDVGSALSLALDDSDRPVVAYYDATNGDLKIVRCTTARCTDSPEPIVADSTGDVGNWPSLALASDSTPVVAYYDASFGDLKVLTCREIDCSGSPSRVPARPCVV